MKHYMILTQGGITIYKNSGTKFVEWEKTMKFFTILRLKGPMKVNSKNVLAIYPIDRPLFCPYCSSTLSFDPQKDYIDMYCNECGGICTYDIPDDFSEVLEYNPLTKWMKRHRWKKS